MSRSLQQPFQFLSSRRAPAVVRQSGPGRTTLHLDLAAAAAAATAPPAAAAVAAAEADGTPGPAAAGTGGRGSRVSGVDGTAAAGRRGGRGRGQGGTAGGAGGLRGRRGWWGGSTRRTPPFLEFWGLASEARSSEAPGQGRWRQQAHQHQGRRPQNRAWFRSPEFFIFVLGLAALLALIVFVTDMLSNRPFQPISVLVFVTAGTYCIALARQQRNVAAAEQALVIEIIDGSAADPRRTVISKEDRRALFDYFKHRPPRPHQDERAASNAQAPDNGGGGGSTSGGGGGGEAGSTAPSSTPPPCPCSPGAASDSAAAGEGGGDKGAGGQPAASPQALDSTAVGGEGVMLAPSSGAEAGLSRFLPAASGATEEEGGIAVDGVERDGSGSPAVMPGCQKPAAVLLEESKESEAPERGTARGDSEEWSTAESCIVCFGEYADGDDLCRLPCRHTYHAECIDAWLDGPDHAWCPLCKSSLLPTEPRNSSTASSATDNRNNGVDRLGPPAAGGTASAVIGDEAV